MPNKQRKTNSLPSLTDGVEPSTLTPNYPKRARFGTCPLCQREVDLTFHHLIPKKMHRRTFFKKNYSKQTLAEGIDICRKCHTGIHKTYDEMQLAKRFNTLEDLQSDPPLTTHFTWVSKQKVTS
jgi:hypothetical protein